MLKKIFEVVTFENFAKYVMFQFMGFHIFYSLLDGGEGNITNIYNWIPAFVLVTMVIVVAVCEFIRYKKHI